MYIVPQVLSQIREHHHIEIRNGAVMRDLLFVEDCIDAMLKLAVSDNAQDDVFNIGSGHIVSISDVCSAALSPTATGCSTTTASSSRPTAARRGRRSRTSSRRCSVSPSRCTPSNRARRGSCRARRTRYTSVSSVQLGFPFCLPGNTPMLHPCEPAAAGFLIADHPAP